MDKVIYKYELTPTGNVSMPMGAEILCVKVQKLNPVIYAKVDPIAKMETRKFYIVPTGDPVPDAFYIGTVLLNNDSLVFHIFDASRLSSR